MSQPILPALPSLKLPPEVATIGSMLIGLATLAATTFGVSPDATNAAVLALQYLIATGTIVAGLVGDLHLHNQHVTLARAQMEISGVQAASVALPPPPATNAPVSPSYGTVTPVLSPLNVQGSSVMTVPAFKDVQITLGNAAPVAPQPAPSDTPTQVVAKVPDATPASAQAATDGGAT